MRTSCDDPSDPRTACLSFATQRECRLSPTQQSEDILDRADTTVTNNDTETYVSGPYMLLCLEPAPHGAEIRRPGRSKSASELAAKREYAARAFNVL